MQLLLRSRMPGVSPKRLASGVLGDIAQWKSNRLQSDRSMVQIRVSPYRFCLKLLFAKQNEGSTGI